MVTKRLTEGAKVRRSFGRSFAQLGRMLPAILVRNWRNVLMPWRMLPYPIILAMFGLVALAMVCAPPEEGTWGEPTATPTATVEVATIGGTDVPADLDCAEDETIGFVGIPDTLVCVHFENYADPDAHGCTRPAFYSEEQTHCVLPDGGLPCASGHTDIDGVCVPDGYGTPVCEPAYRNDGLPPDTHCLMYPLPTAEVFTCGLDEQNRQMVFNPATGYCEYSEKQYQRPPAGDANCDDDAPAGYTWQGSQADGYICVPLDNEFEGRSGLITTANGTVSYHTAPCLPDEIALPPPYADVTLCVNAIAYRAIQ